MKSIKLVLSNNSKGQAATELLLCIPVLVLLAAGMVQFCLLFQSKVQFEYACGESARAYNLGKVQPDGFADSIWENLNSYQSRFEKGSIHVSAEASQSLLGGDAGQKLGFIGKYVTGSVFNYGGQQWTVKINCKIVPLFGVLFPHGVPFSTQLAVLRHPQ